MNFRLYFLQEGTRTYDKSDLITYFKANSSITSEKEGDNRVFTFHHPILNFEARFIMTAISCVPRLEKLNPKFFDVNFMLEFNILLPTYSAEIVFDMVEDIIKMFKFYVYNEAYQDVIPFRKSFMIKTFESWKRAYKDDNEDEIANYNRLDPQTLSQVYNYLLRQKKLEIFLDPSVVISNYYFLRTDRSRSAFVTIKWDGESPFILPPAVDVLYLNDGKTSRYLPMSEVLQKTEKLFKPIDGYGVIQMMDAKNVKKFHKILVKEKFAPLIAELKFLPLENILDI